MIHTAREDEHVSVVYFSCVRAGMQRIDTHCFISIACATVPDASEDCAMSQINEPTNENRRGVVPRLHVLVGSL